MTNRAHDVLSTIERHGLPKTGRERELCLRMIKDALDAYFEERTAAVRNALREEHWARILLQAHPQDMDAAWGDHVRRSCAICALLTDPRSSRSLMTTEETPGERTLREWAGF